MFYKVTLITIAGAKLDCAVLCVFMNVMNS